MVTYVASATATQPNGTDGTAVTVDKPTGTLEGHYMIAVTHGYVGDTFTAPSGWTLIDAQNDGDSGTSLRSRVYTKFAGASEPSNYTFTFQPGPGGGTIGASITTFANTTGIDAYTYDRFMFDPTLMQLKSTRNAMFYSVITWRDTTSDSATWTGATEAFDIRALDNGTIYRGQTGAYSTQVDAGTVVTHEADLTNSIQYSINWMFALGDAAPATESWNSSGIAVEIEFEEGTWTDVTSDVQYDEGISITRGTSSQGGQVSPSVATFRLDNRSGNYSIKNPVSPYYGLIGYNTPCRISKTHGDIAYQTPGYDNYSGTEAQTVSRVKTGSTSSLNIAGDIDVRAYVEPETWKQAQVIAAKWSALPFIGSGADDSSSWLFQINSDATLSFMWNDGSVDNFFAAFHKITSTSPVPAAIRQYVRVTLDVNNGASGHTVVFYTSTDGSSWTQLGNSVVTSGTTAIAPSMTSLTVGALEPSARETAGFVYDLDAFNMDVNQAQFTINDGVWVPTTRPFLGKIYNVSVRSGIAGTVVASPTFTSATNGSYSITDSQGNVWVIDGLGVFTNRHYRHHGEITSWPQPRTSEGNFAWVDIESSSPLQREQQGEEADLSALYQYYTNPKGINAITTGSLGGGYGRAEPVFPVGYWPIEDGEDTENVSSALDGGIPGTIYGAVEFGQGDFYVGSKPIAKIKTGQSLKFDVKNAVAGAYVCEFLLYTPSGMTHGTDIVNLYTSGTDYRFRLAYTGTNTFAAYIYNKAGTLLDSQTGITMTISTLRARLYVVGWNGGVGVFYQTQGSYQLVDSGIFLDNGTGTTGKFSSVSLTPDQSDGVYVGHVAVFDGVNADAYPYGAFFSNGYPNYDDALIGLSSERAARRARRLINYREMTPYVIGDNGEVMGRLYPNTFSNNLRQCQESDGGYVYEPRNFLGLGYRTLNSMYNTAPVFELDYSNAELSGSFDPLIDNQGVVNDVTVTKVRGGSGRYVKTSGANNVNRPPEGAGRYQVNQEISLYSVAQTLDQAAWRVFLGTNDELKVNQVTLALENLNFNDSNDIINRFYTADIGDSFTIDNLPDLLMPDQMRQLIVGYTEVFDQYQHSITFNTIPGSSFAPGRTTGTTSTTSTKANSAHSTLYSSATNSATSLNVTTEDGYARWVTSADSVFNNFDINVAGERMTVTAVGVADSFTRSSSNGWGSASSGQAWTTAGGSASEYSVNGTLGLISLASVNVSRYVVTSSPAADVDLQCAFATSALATGGPHYVGVVARYTDANNNYYARLAFNTSQTCTLVIQKRVAGVQTDITSVVVPGTHAASRFFNVRFQVIGSALKAKAWQVGNPEPDWQLSTTDSDITATGSIGVRGILSSANTNTLPVTMSADNFRLNSPQVFTVTRSVNGIVKAQSSGAQVQLFKPRHAALFTRGRKI